MQDTTEIPIPRQALMSIFRAVQALKRSMDREFEPMELTGQQAGLLLRCAQKSAGQTFDGVARGLGTDSAGVTRLADRLEGKGLLTRQASAADRRATQLVLTQAGREIVPAVRRSFERWRSRALKDITETEQQQLMQLMARIAANAEPEAETAQVSDRP